MKVLALSRKQRPFIPQICKDMENPPVFTVVSMPKSKHLEILAKHKHKIPTSIFNKITKKDTTDLSNEEYIDLSETWKIMLHNYEITEEILQYGLKRWENLKNEDGEDIPFNVNDFELLIPELRTELANEIIGVINEDDSKNLGKLSLSQNGSPSETVESMTAETANTEKTETVTEEATPTTA